MIKYMHNVGSILFQNRPPVSAPETKVVFGGDFCPGSTGTPIVENGNAASVLNGIRPFVDDAGIRIVQFETPLAEAPAPIAKTGPNLLSHPKTAALLDGVFNIAALANNHIGDQGAKAVLDTIGFLEKGGLKTVGAGADIAAASTPLRIECAGRRISIVNRCECEFGIADDNTAGAAPQNPLTDLECVADEAKTSDAVVVILHGGHEHFPFPSPRLQLLCRAFVDAGASLVVNCHTHCPQGIEWHHGVPIIYSPGNLWFPASPDGVPHPPSVLWSYGFVAKALFDDNGVFAIEILPVTFDGLLVKPLGKEVVGEFGNYIKAVSQPLSDKRKLESLFDAWCAISGRNYFRDATNALFHDLPFQTSLPPENTEHLQAWLQIRNLFSCESHADLVRRYLLLVEKGTADAARKSASAVLIRDLQKPLFAAQNDKADTYAKMHEHLPQTIVKRMISLFCRILRKTGKTIYLCGVERR